MIFLFSKAKNLGLDFGPRLSDLSSIHKKGIVGAKECGILLYSIGMILYMTINQFQYLI